MATSSVSLAAVDFGSGVSDAWRSVATFVPRFAAFLVVLLVGWMVAKLLAKAVNAILERVGFDKAVERGGVAKAMERTKYDASDIIAKLIYYAVLLITLQVAFSVFGPNPISDLLRGVVAWLPQVAVAIVIVVVATAIAAGVRDLIRGALGGLSYGNLLATIASVFIVALGVIAALNQIGIAVSVTMPVLITVLATVGGILVVGVGGGMVKPMQQRWDRWLTSAEQQTGTARGQMEAYRRGRQDALDATRTQPAPAPVQHAGAAAPAQQPGGRPGGAYSPGTTAQPGNPQDYTGGGRGYTGGQQPPAQY
ncbi:mechanosensitive ion channel family protein [Streptomyces thermolineatus]|uniref:mechanosensitive ion channel family protein n=1 Tax=Streptomyces thermolineatus TaxID=44033 RepID=UPI00384ACCA3